MLPRAVPPVIYLSCGHRLGFRKGPYQPGRCATSECDCGKLHHATGKIILSHKPRPIGLVVTKDTCDSLLSMRFVFILV